MGAWGSGPFENDDAADWAWELDDAQDHAVLRAAFDRAGRDPDLDAGDGAVVVAAAAVVAASVDGDASGMSDEVVAYIARAGRPDAALVDRARSALDTVSAGGELAELWDETEDESWREGIASLRDRLATGGADAG